MDLANMRASYEKGALHRRDLDGDPIQQFTKWFDEACQSKLVEPNAASLATADIQGRPLLRTILIKQFDSRGFIFFTNFESRKARHIQSNPAVCVLFPWVALERQVIVCGTASKVSVEETEIYFTQRPIDSQVGAWASKQSSVIDSRETLEKQWQQIKEKFPDGRIPPPPFWGGFRVEPATMEFWQGRSNRLHDRFLYTRQPDNCWTIDRLSP